MIRNNELKYVIINIFIMSINLIFYPIIHLLTMFISFLAENIKYLLLFTIDPDLKIIYKKWQKWQYSSQNVIIFQKKIHLFCFFWKNLTKKSTYLIAVILQADVCEFFDGNEKSEPWDNVLEFWDTFLRWFKPAEEAVEILILSRGLSNKSSLLFDCNKF